MYHAPVLVKETLDALTPQPGAIAVDCTLGGAGHARLIAERIGPEGHLIAFDQDPDAIAHARHALADVPCRVTLIADNFAHLDAQLRALGLTPPALDILLADVGVSSHQIDTPQRGFSFQEDGPLDMRMAQSGETAGELIARLDANALADVLYHYGDIRASRRLARAMKKASSAGQLESTGELAELAARVLGRPRRGGLNPATLVFQALRIAVNRELEALETLLDATPTWLRAGGRAGFIAFHSGEDRIVKHTLKRFEDPCVCPPRLPRCACGAVPLGRSLRRKPFTATEAEIQANPRARSARLRVFVRA